VSSLYKRKEEGDILVSRPDEHIIDEGMEFMPDFDELMECVALNSESRPRNIPILSTCCGATAMSAAPVLNDAEASLVGAIAWPAVVPPATAIATSTCSIPATPVAPMEPQYLVTACTEYSLGDSCLLLAQGDGLVRVGAVLCGGQTQPVNVILSTVGATHCGYLFGADTPLAPPILCDFGQPVRNYHAEFDISIDWFRHWYEAAAGKPAIQGRSPEDPLSPGGRLLAAVLQYVSDDDYRARGALFRAFAALFPARAAVMRAFKPATISHRGTFYVVWDYIGGAACFCPDPIPSTIRSRFRYPCPKASRMAGLIDAYYHFSLEVGLVHDGVPRIVVWKDITTYSRYVTVDDAIMLMAGTPAYESNWHEFDGSTHCGLRIDGRRMCSLLVDPHCTLEKAWDIAAEVFGSYTRHLRDFVRFERDGELRPNFVERVYTGGQWKRLVGLSNLNDRIPLVSRSCDGPRIRNLLVYWLCATFRIEPIDSARYGIAVRWRCFEPGGESMAYVLHKLGDLPVPDLPADYRSAELAAAIVEYSRAQRAKADALDKQADFLMGDGDPSSITMIHIDDRVARADANLQMWARRVEDLKKGL
jgi:hypothetical protein